MDRYQTGKNQLGGDQMGMEQLEEKQMGRNRMERKEHPVKIGFENDRKWKKRLEEYTVLPPDPSAVRRTAREGRRYMMIHQKEFEYGRNGHILSASGGFAGSVFSCVVNQFRYLSPALWFTEAAVLVFCMLIVEQTGNSADRELLFSFLSFFAALLGTLGFPELCRSFSCRMWELEQSCRYDLRQIISVRLFLIGVTDLVLLLLVSGMVSSKMGILFWKSAVYLLVPFNLSCITVFCVLGLLRDSSSFAPVYFSGAVVSLLIFIGANRLSIYQKLPLFQWNLILALTVFVLLNRISHFLGSVAFAADQKERSRALWN